MGICISAPSTSNRQHNVKSVDHNNTNNTNSTNTNHTSDHATYTTLAIEETSEMGQSHSRSQASTTAHPQRSQSQSLSHASNTTTPATVRVPSPSGTPARHRNPHTHNHTRTHSHSHAASHDESRPSLTSSSMDPLTAAAIVQLAVEQQQSELQKQHAGDTSLVGASTAEAVAQEIASNSPQLAAAYIAAGNLQQTNVNGDTSLPAAASDSHSQRQRHTHHRRERSHSNSTVRIDRNLESHSSTRAVTPSPAVPPSPPPSQPLNAQREGRSRHTRSNSASGTASHVSGRHSASASASASVSTSVPPSHSPSPRRAAVERSSLLSTQPLSVTQLRQIQHLITGNTASSHSTSSHATTSSNRRATGDAQHSTAATSDNSSTARQLPLTSRSPTTASGTSAHRRSSIVSHVRIDRYTTNELLESREHAYQPIHEPRNSSVQSLGLLEKDEKMVHGIPISSQRQYTTPPQNFIPNDVHLKYMSSLLPDPFIHVHSCEDVSHMQRNTPVYDIVNPLHQCQQQQLQHDLSLAKNNSVAGGDVIKHDEDMNTDISSKQRSNSPISDNVEHENDDEQSRTQQPQTQILAERQNSNSSVASSSPSKLMTGMQEDNDSFIDSRTTLTVT